MRNPTYQFVPGYDLRPAVGRQACGVSLGLVIPSAHHHFTHCLMLTQS